MGNEVLQNIKVENFEGALNHIISLMNVSEKEKVKRLEVLAGLEKKVIRRLQSGKDEEALEELKDIIDEYKRLNLTYKAQLLELTLNQYILESCPPALELEEPPIIDSSDEMILIQGLEFRSKKAVRRFLQGKTDEAVEGLLEIIEEYRKLQMNDRAQAIEDWMYQFLEKKLDAEEQEKPLAERLEYDPELQEQLLSFRTQKVIKRFVQGKPRKAVEEFTAFVNDYKSQGKLEIVEMLEIWFNLFITKMFLVKPDAEQPQPVPKPVEISIPAPTPETPVPAPPLTESPPASPTERFKSKISKIKNLLKQFEDSI